MFRTFLFLVAVFSSLSAHAATWYGFTLAQTDDELFYFDQDSVVKHGDKVTIWTKSIRKVNTLNQDGSFSVATRVVYSCKMKTVQALAQINYGQNGQVQSSDTLPGNVSEIVPGTVGEGMIEAVCSRNFPKVGKSPLYYSVEGNDAFEATQVYFATLAILKVDAAPREPAWYALTNANNDEYQYFFDLKSVEKAANEVTVWVLSIHKSKSPKKWVGMASGNKVHYFCGRRTVKYDVFSSYDDEGKFIASFSGGEKEEAIKDDAIASEIIKAVCSADFPKIEGTDSYSEVSVNDPYLYARKYFEYLNAEKPSADPTTVKPHERERQ